MAQTPTDIINTHRTQVIADIYDRCSGVYDWVLKPWLEAGRGRAMELLDVRPQDRLLEVGVGTGLSFDFYPRRCRQAVAFDFSAGMLRQARRRLEANTGPDVGLLQANAERLPFADHSFDRVLAAYVMTVVPDTSRAVAELLRVVRPGGRVVLINHLRSKNQVLSVLEDWLHPFFSRIGLFTLDRDLLGILRAHGVTEPELESTSMLGLHYLIAFDKPWR